MPFFLAKIAFNRNLPSFELKRVERTRNRKWNICRKIKKKAYVTICFKQRKLLENGKKAYITIIFTQAKIARKFKNNCISFNQINTAKMSRNWKNRHKILNLKYAVCLAKIAFNRNLPSFELKLVEITRNRKWKKRHMLQSVLNSVNG